MLGSSRRLTVLVLALLLTPGALAGAPVANLSTAFSLGGQDVLDLAMEPRGEYVVGVVPVDPASLVSGIAGQQRHDDIYPCHFGPPSSVGSGSGCRSPGLQHGQTRRTTTLSARQAVDYTSFTSPTGVVARYAVAGPSDVLSLWASTQDTPVWELQVGGSQAVVNVTIAPDASRILAGTAAASGAGRLVMYNATPSAPALLWDFNLSNTRPTAMDYARSGSVMIVGASPATATTSGEVFLIRPTTRSPVAGQDLFRYDMGSADVNDVELSREGRAAVIATSQHVHFYSVDPAKGSAVEAQRWNRQVTGGCQRVSVAGDGNVFAAACGNRVLFFRYLGTELVAQDLGAYDAGAPVADLAYDASGELLVAIAGNRVYGFGSSKTTPIWSFDATGAGGLDGPLRKVVVSDLGERFVVAGRTTLMPYRSTVAAQGTFEQAQGLAVQPSTNVRLQLTVTNKGSMPDNYTFSARFPAGWNGFSPNGVRLDPEESATLNFTMDVPAGQAPGFYGVEVDIRSQTLQRMGRDRLIVATPALNLTVPRSVVLNLTTTDERLPSLRQGGEITVPVTIRNRGNAEGIVNLSTTQLLSRGAPWDLRFQNEQVAVPAGGERTVNLIVVAPQDAASGDRNRITICAREDPSRTCTKDVTQLYEATREIVAYVDPRFGAELTTNATSFEFGPGELRTVSVTILNTGNTDDAFNLTTTLSPATVQNDWRVTLERDYLQIPRGEKRTVTVTVRAAVSDPRDATLLVKAISIGSTLTEDSTLSINLVPRPPTPTKDDKLLPFPTLLGVLTLVGLAAVLRRRGGA